VDADGKTMRVRDVFYWYIDYRDFTDVVKYRIAMMRKGIDEKVKEVGLL
jgi:transcription initiation factor TFIIE subunit alpha